MFNAKKSYLLLFVIITIGLTGCFDVNREFREIRNDVRDAIDCRLKKDTEFRAGSGLIGLAQSFISFSDDTDAEEANEILDEINSVQVGVYKNKSRKFNPEHALDDVEETLSDKDWEMLIRKNSRREYTLVMVQMDDDIYEKMLVIDFNRSELVICEITGDLEKIVEKTIEEDDICFEIND
ncbi:MAG: DUF4252 domain-containing protein [Rhodothermaceae bacterium]